MMIPNRQGVWQNSQGTCLEIYILEPTGHLCFWAKDLDRLPWENNFWVTDEFLGHLPVDFLDDDWQIAQLQ
jgi:hypothetical protein